MAYFAKLDSDNKVIECVRVNDPETMIDGVINEDKGISFLKKIYKDPSFTWVRYNKFMTQNVNTQGGENLRKNAAVLNGGYYDPSRDAFIPPKAKNPDGTECTTLVFDEDTCFWNYPTPKPNGEIDLNGEIWEYGDIGGWTRLDTRAEGSVWEYDSVNGWVDNTPEEDIPQA